MTEMEFKPAIVQGAMTRRWSWALLRRPLGRWHWATNERGGLDRWWVWQAVPDWSARHRWRAVIVHEESSVVLDHGFSRELIGDGPHWWCDLIALGVRMTSSPCPEVVVERNPEYRSLWSRLSKAQQSVFVLGGLAALIVGVPIVIAQLAGRGVPHP